MVEVIGTVIDRFLALLTAPVDFPDMLWILSPLVLTMLLIELYFARYKFEELGWNSAFGNVLVLLFVAIDLFRFLYVHNELTYIGARNILVITLTVVGILLSVANFLHVWSKKFAYGISDKLPVNFLAYMTVLLVYSDLPIDFVTLIASIGILVIFVGVILGLKYLIPKAIELDEEEYIERENAPQP